MTEAEFRSRWQEEKSLYKIWGDYVSNSIHQALVNQGIDLATFLKVHVTPRVKLENSLIDKAFYRGKKYANPYDEIEDKVGIRFVVLLIEDIEKVSRSIECNKDWNFERCKHFEHDKENDPLLFTYQSVHYVVRSMKKLNISGVEVPKDIPCEIQIRTLLQHAHAELTHDAIYKSKRAVQPRVQRTVAKSMALIETTDDFFSEVTSLLNEGPLKDFNIFETIDSLYENFTGLKPSNNKSSLTVWDAYEDLVDGKLIGSIQRQLLNLSDYSTLKDTIVLEYPGNAFYQQSIVLFVYWMLLYRKRRLIRDWPLQRNLLEMLATDVGQSLEV